MKENDDIKNNLKMARLMFFLILYIHFTGCLWFFINNIVNEDNLKQDILSQE